LVLRYKIAYGHVAGVPESTTLNSRFMKDTHLARAVVNSSSEGMMSCREATSPPRATPIFDRPDRSIAGADGAAGAEASSTSTPVAAVR
jgi:hypothetical protein